VKGSLFASVATAASNDVWAAGLQNDGSNSNAKPLTEHWDGTSWSLLATPSGVNLHGVTALSDGIVVAVGAGSNNSAVILQN
jgi:hypothetical protein